MKGAVLVSTVLALATVAAWTTAVPVPVMEPRDLEAAVRPIPPIDTLALATAAARIRARNPFRLDRKPADVRYNPWESSAPVAVPEPRRAVPPLALAGLIGPPWNALVEGIPGREPGALLKLGEALNGITFVSLRGDTVLLAGFDTTWTLTARQGWR